MLEFITKLLGSRNERLMKRLQQRVTRITAFEPALQALSDEQLAAKTAEFKERLAQGATIDQLLEEAFATVREVSHRTLGMRHFDEQLLGGMVLHEGKIAEMQTGEGKTLVATLPAYLNALTGEGVHIVTVNDYLARRDAEWMRPIYEFLGLTLGVNIPGMMNDQKIQAYNADILYGTNNEFGFDYLRDNMAFSNEDRVNRRPLNYAIVDEVDSILIDEARTPLIISGRLEDSSALYIHINKIIPALVERKDENGPGDFTIDLKAKNIHLTEAGQEQVEKLLRQEGLLQEGEDLYSPSNLVLVHHLIAGLRAHHLFALDVDYLINESKEVVIVDEHTGRTMPGRRWSDGLHQAIEAKENVPVQNENQTLASTTFQNYFRLYDKLAGMTGTADTEAFEFHQTYGLEVVAIPTHKKCVRKDMRDLVYQKVEDKYRAIIQDIKDCRERQQPVLVGTTSIENSELLSHLLKKESIPHQVLNAKYHEKEAGIIIEAGRPGAVTIATNMAGRGTDIVLGGNLDAEILHLGENPSEAEIADLKKDWAKRHEIVMQAGGLRVIGSERHESRRIDNQLRGRSARQGDPGSSRFYLSLQDPLMRIFASDRVASLMQKLGLQDDQNIESGVVTHAIEKAQKRVEAHHFDIRKQLLEYDDVANEQRKVIYSLRNNILSLEDMSEYIHDMRNDVFTDLVLEFMPPETLEDQWEIIPLQDQLLADFGLECPVQLWLEEESHLNAEGVMARILQMAKEAYAQKEEALGFLMMRKYEKAVMLQVLDNSWREHLAAMDYMRQGIGLRGFAQKDPKQEYKREAFVLFSSLLEEFKLEAIKVLMRFRVANEEDLHLLEERRKISIHEVRPDPDAEEEGDSEAPHLVIERNRKIGRNEPCYCGSGKKYKYCHGVITSEMTS
jgi:preprotein translocase subunit SecA